MGQATHMNAQVPWEGWVGRGCVLPILWSGTRDRIMPQYLGMACAVCVVIVVCSLCCCNCACGDLEMKLTQQYVWYSVRFLKRLTIAFRRASSRSASRSYVRVDTILTASPLLKLPIWLNIIKLS